MSFRYPLRRRVRVPVARHSNSVPGTRHPYIEATARYTEKRRFLVYRYPGTRYRFGTTEAQSRCNPYYRVQ